MRARLRKLGNTLSGCVLVAATAATGWGSPAGAQQVPSPESVPLHFESKIGDISNEAFAEQGLAALNDPRGWGQAGFTFKSESSWPNPARSIRSVYR